MRPATPVNASQRVDCFCILSKAALAARLSVPNGGSRMAGRCRPGSELIFMIKKLIAVAVVLLLLAAGAWGYLILTAKPPVSYRTAEIKHGSLLASISATGTLEPEELVDVGAQVGGQILTFGKDPND